MLDYLATALVGMVLGALAALWAGRGWMYQQIGQARADAALHRADARRERQRADNAVDQLAAAQRGEPISVAAVERRTEAFEEAIRARDDCREMFMDETEEVADAETA